MYLQDSSILWEITVPDLKRTQARHRAVHLSKASRRWGFPRLYWGGTLSPGKTASQQVCASCSAD